MDEDFGRRVSKMAPVGSLVVRGRDFEGNVDGYGNYSPDGNYGEIIFNHGNGFVDVRWGEHWEKKHSAGALGKFELYYATKETIEFSKSYSPDQYKINNENSRSKWLDDLDDLYVGFGSTEYIHYDEGYLQNPCVETLLNEINKNKNGKINVSTIASTITEGQRKRGNIICSSGEGIRFEVGHVSDTKISSRQKKC